MKKLKEHIKRIFETYKRTKKSSLIAYFLVRILVILCLIRQIINLDIENVLICILTLILLMLPMFIKKNFKVELPDTLETIIVLFIFAAEILGEINSFYQHIPIWDTILHTLNGFLCAAVGFSLINLLNKNIDSINMSNIFVVLVSFCFSMTVGVCWEFLEYSIDRTFGMDMQKDTVVNHINTVYLDESKQNKVIKIGDIDHTDIYDKSNHKIATITNGYLDIGLNDTIKDLMVNFVGAVVFNFMAFFYLKDRDENSIINKFIIKTSK